jgi:hypothetical protein
LYDIDINNVAYNRLWNHKNSGTLMTVGFSFGSKGSLKAVPWLRRLVAGLSLSRPGSDPGSVHVGFVVEKVALGQVFPRVLRFSPVSFIPPVFHYLKQRKKLIIFLNIFITVLRNNPQGCVASVASAAWLFTTRKKGLPEDGALARKYAGALCIILTCKH